MELCCVVARHTPAYGIGVLLPDMLSIELSGWDALMIGLRALLTMLIAAPSWGQGNQQPTFQARSAPLCKWQIILTYPGSCRAVQSDATIYDPDFEATSALR